MSSAGESPLGPATGPEERLRGHESALEPGDSSATPAETLDNPPEHRGESDNQGGNTGDTPGDSSQTGAGAGPGAGAAAGPGPEKRTRDGSLVEVQPVPEGKRNRDYDWPRIKARYVEGVPDRDQGITLWPTLNDVAAHFQLPANRIREKAAMDGWVEERNRYQAQTEAVRRSARAAAMSKHATDLDGSALQAAKAGLQLCQVKLADMTRRVQAARSENVGDPTVGVTIDAQEMQRLAQAIDLFHKIGLRAVGDPETHRLEITGAGGRPIEISQELKRDDPTRLTGVLAVLRQAGLGELFGGDGLGEVVGRGGDAGGTALGHRAADGDHEAAEPR